MPDELLHHFGKWMIAAGIVLALLGVLFLFADRIPFLGKLPGDIHIRGKNFTFYFPMMTCIILSIVLSLFLLLLNKLR